MSGPHYGPWPWLMLCVCGLVIRCESQKAAYRQGEYHLTPGLACEGVDHAVVYEEAPEPR